MAKKGMKRVERTHTKPRNEQAAVPEIQGKAKSSKVQARAIIAGTSAPAQKVYHAKPHRVTVVIRTRQKCSIKAIFVAFA
ncbi:MAG: hypothetical protein ACI4IL_09000, partial [Eubacterium sp.]